MDAFAVPLLLLVGALLAVQAAANVQLSVATGSPFGASAIQLGVGAFALLIGTAVAGSLGAFELLDGVPLWHLIGGLGSAIYITSGILLFPRVGAVLTVALWVTGQMLASLALDGFGWLGVESRPLNAWDVIGCLAVLLGASLIVRVQAEPGTLADVGRTRFGWLALGVLAGAALPLQGAINAQLRADLDAPLTTAALSFLVATAGMAILLAAVLSVAKATPPTLKRLPAMPWWGWVGGLIGATYVTSVFLLIPEIGAAPVIALAIGGQQVASILVDRYGLFRLPRRPISPLRLAAVAALIAGVMMIQVA